MKFKPLHEARCNPRIGLRLGGVIGARWGTMTGRRLKAAQLRLLLAVLVLGIAGRLVYELYVAPKPEYRLEDPA